MSLVCCHFLSLLYRHTIRSSSVVGVDCDNIEPPRLLAIYANPDPDPSPREGERLR